MMKEQQPREERRERRRRPIWGRSIIGVLVLLLLVQTAYIIYMHYGAALAVGRVSQTVMDSPGLANLRELTANIELNTPPGQESLTPQDQQQLDEAAEQLGGLLGGGGTEDGIQNILAMATQLRTLYDDALNMAEDPLGTHGIDRWRRRQALGHQPQTGAVELESGGKDTAGMLIIAERPDGITATLEPEGALTEVDVSLEGQALVVTTKTGATGRASTIRKRLPAAVEPSTLDTSVHDGRVVIKLDKRDPAPSPTPSTPAAPAAFLSRAAA